MVSCNFANSGCSGGWLAESTNYLINHGVVSESCLSYHSFGGADVRCSYQCDDKATPYKKYGCKFNSMKIMTNAEEI